MIHVESGCVSTASLNPPSPPKLISDQPVSSSDREYMLCQAYEGALAESSRVKGGDEVVKGEVKGRRIVSAVLEDDV